MPTLIGNAPGLKVKNTSVDYDSITDEEKLNYLRDKMGRDIPNIHNLSDTEKADYQRLKELEKQGWAKVKEKEDGIQSKIEGSKRAANIMSAGKKGSILKKDDADLANQTPAGGASADGILPGGDGSTGGSGSGSGSDNNAGGDNPNGGGGANGNPKAKQEGKYKLRSIMDAYNEGLLDKESRDYLIVDALSKFARNTGKDLANLAAAYTGGSVNNDRESGIWEERNKAMAEKGIGAEGNQYKAGDQYDLGYQSQEAALESQRLANAKERIRMAPAKNFQEMANKLRDTDPTAAGFLDLIAAASTQGVDPEEYIAMAYATDPNAKKLVDEVFKAGSNAASSIAEIAETVNGMGSDIKVLTNALRKKFNL